jgi:hypothetical protein
MQDDKVIVWADGDTQNAIEMDVRPMSGVDIDLAAFMLGCEPGEVNQCSPDQLDIYGVSLKTEMFKRPKGLAN